MNGLKLVHLSDLHLGKRVNEFSMIEDQKYILTKIINIIDDEKPDGVILAGDIYDKSMPSAEAVELFDEFLVRLSKRELQIFVISGNHDSPERLAFGNRLMDKSGVHIAPVYNGSVLPFVLEDGFGEADIYLLPFVKPVNVRRFFPDEEIESYTDAVRTAIAAMNIDRSRRNVLVTHQFVTGAKRSESEEISVGGSDNVDASVFEAFDYVALGHIHGPQDIGSERIRYCGTPLKYSFSEASHQKSVTIVELGEKKTISQGNAGEIEGNDPVDTEDQTPKCDISVRTVPLEPVRDLKEIKGKYDELTLKSYYDGTTYQEDYMHITLTDEEDVMDAASKLRVIYHNMMKLDYDNTRTRHNAAFTESSGADSKSPIELFEDFYLLQNGVEMSEDQRAYVSSLMEEIKGDSK